MCKNVSADVVTLDDLIEAAFERASFATSSPKVAAELASRTVARWLARTGRQDLVRLLKATAISPNIGRLPKSMVRAQAA